MDTEFTGDPFVRPAALTQLLCALAPARLNGDLMRATAASRRGRWSWCVAIRRPWPAGLDAAWFLNDGGERRWRLLVGCVVAGRGLVCHRSGEDDRQVGDRQQHNRRHRRHTGGKYTGDIGIGGDYGMDRVRGHRHGGATDQQCPRIPGRPVTGERDGRDGGDDYDPVDNQRTITRLTRYFYRTSSKYRQC